MKYDKSLCQKCGGVFGRPDTHATWCPLSAAPAAQPVAEQVNAADTERLDSLAKLYKACPHAIMTWNDDPETPGPVGYSISIDGCDPITYIGETLRELLDLIKREFKPVPFVSIPAQAEICAPRCPLCGFNTDRCCERVDCYMTGKTTDADLRVQADAVAAPTSPAPAEGTPERPDYIKSIKDFSYAEWWLFEQLEALFPADYLSDVGGDPYDDSFELYFSDKVPGSWKITTEVKAIHNLGCIRFWANFYDDTEQYNGGERHKVSRSRKAEKRDDRINKLERSLAAERAKVAELEKRHADAIVEAENEVWDMVIEACHQAWPEDEKVFYNQSPTELIIDIINERDAGESRLQASEQKVAALQAFKDFVHMRLDKMGIEKEPNGEHSKQGCRIGDRLDIVESERRASEQALKIAEEELQQYKADNSQFGAGA